MNRARVKFGALLSKAYSLDGVFPVLPGALPQAKLMLPLWGDSFRTILDDSLRIVLTAPRGHSNLAWGKRPR